MRLSLLAVAALLPIAVSTAACGDSAGPKQKAAEVRPTVQGAARLSGRGSDVTPEPRPVLAPRSESGPPSFAPLTKRVRVVDMKGRAIRGASVRSLRGGSEDGYLTDESGRAPTGHLGGGHGTPTQFRRSWTVVVEADGYAPHAHCCRANDYGEEVVTLRTRGYVLAGRCRDAAGRGVRPRRLVLRGGEAELAIQADARGGFRTAAAPPRRQSLHALADGWIARSVDVTPPDESVEVVFFRPSVIHGTLALALPQRRAALRRLRFEPQAYDVDVDPDTGRFQAVVFPGTVSLWVGRTLLGAYAIEESGNLDLGALHRPPETPPSARRAPPPPKPFVDLEFGAREEREFHVVGAFEDLGLMDLGYARPADARVELPSAKLLWLGFGPSISDSWWRQEAGVGDRLRVQSPDLVPVRMGTLQIDGEYVARGGLALRWRGTRIGAVSLNRSAFDGKPPAVGPGVYDLVWYPSFHAECVVLRRGISVAQGDELLDLGDAVVPEPVVLRVRVEDDDGKALAGVAVSLERGRDSLALRTDAWGEATFRLRDPTRITLVAESPGLGRATRRFVTLDEDHLVVLRLAR